MNLQLHHVGPISPARQGFGSSRAILEGDPAALARLRDQRCHASVETITKALTEHYRAEHLFALEQALALYDAHHGKASACNARIEVVLKQLSFRRGRKVAPLPSLRRGMRRQPNGPVFDVRAALFGCGKDLTHSTSWLCPAPSIGWQGAVVAHAGSGNRAAALLRLAAVTVDEPTPPWVPSTDGFPCASARSGRSPRPRARLRFPSATPLASREGLHRPGGVLLRGPLSRTGHRQLASARQRFRLRLPTKGAVGPFLGKRAFRRPIASRPRSTRKFFSHFLNPSTPSDD